MPLCRCPNTEKNRHGGRRYGTPTGSGSMVAALFVEQLRNFIPFQRKLHRGVECRIVGAAQSHGSFSRQIIQKRVFGGFARGPKFSDRLAAVRRYDRLTAANQSQIRTEMLLQLTNLYRFHHLKAATALRLPLRPVIRLLRTQFMMNPASTLRVWPVTPEDWSAAKNSATLATSSSVTILTSALCDTKPRSTCS